jgi:alpha-L-fucosidase 2
MKIEATLLLSLLLSPVHGSTSASTTIWFGKPGVIWTDALPVGNGRLGAVVHGGYGMEQVGLNEDSIWSGGLQKRVNPKALAAFPGIPEAFKSGNISRADDIWHNDLKGTGTQVRQYQPAGNMMIEFGQNVSSVSGYNRSLDLTTGENQVSYTRNDVTYLRQAIASYPHDALGFRYTADKAGALDMKIALARNESVTGLKVDLQKLAITMYGQGTNDSSLKFVHSIRVVADTGMIHGKHGVVLMLMGIPAQATSPRIVPQ